MEKIELQKVCQTEDAWGLSAAQMELLNQVEIARGVGLEEASCPIEEVRQLIRAGLLRLEVTSFLWGTDFRIVPAMASASRANT